MKPDQPQHTGTHLIADLHGINEDTLADTGGIELLLRHAALRAGATIIYSHFHAFGPGHGVTGVVLLAESHISIHTWPELGFAAIDIFMCGAAQPQLALACIAEKLVPRSHTVTELQRGYSIAAHHRQ